MPIAKIASASSGRAVDIDRRSPPAKKVFLALVTTTPATSPAATSASSRSIAAPIDSL